MKKIIIIFSFLINFCPTLIFAEDPNALKKLLELQDIASPNSQPEDKLVPFNFKDEDLTKIINHIAALKNINVILPQSQNKIAAKVTFYNDKDIPLHEAWSLLDALINIAGYSLINKGDTYQIVPANNAAKDALPIYANLPIEALPDSGMIRYVYYFKNLNISDATAQSAANLQQLFKDILPAQSNYILDPNSNSLILTADTNIVRSVINTVQDLDKIGLRETLEVVQLINSRSDQVVKILEQLIPETGRETFKFGATQPASSKSTYFSASTKVLSIDRTNSILILGRKESVLKVKDFILTYIDKPVGKGKSILHVKPLQYRNANELAKVLQNVINAQKTTQAAGTPQIHDEFSDIIIAAEKTEEIQPVQLTQNLTAQSPTGQDIKGQIVGGNNLIIAAREKDYVLLEKLIDELDNPDYQVAIEALIVDISFSDNKLLGAQSRNPATYGQSINNGCVSPQNFNWQAAHLGSEKAGSIVVLNFIGQPPALDTTKGLSSNLLLPLPGPPGSAPFNIATASPVGTTVISFEDGNGISYILEWLDKYFNATILAQPFVITANHQKASIFRAETRIVKGGVSDQSTGGPVNIQNVTLPASLKIDIVPNITKQEQDGTTDISLSIVVTAEDFLSTNLLNNTRRTRSVQTNAIVNDKQVLVLGGGTSFANEDNQTETPILSKIPIIGNLFKRRTRDVEKDTLLIFVAPRIIPPRMGPGIDEYTKSKLNYAKAEGLYSEKGIYGTNFASLKEPITRIFFPPFADEINQGICHYEYRSIFNLEQDIKECSTEDINKGIAEFKIEREKNAYIEPDKNEDVQDKKINELKEKIKDAPNPIKTKT